MHLDLKTLNKYRSQKHSLPVHKTDTFQNKRVCLLLILEAHTVCSFYIVGDTKAVTRVSPSTYLLSISFFCFLDNVVNSDPVFNILLPEVFALNSVV